eukprot:8736356-Ditylum_brightwellii.AAC.1
MVERKLHHVLRFDKSGWSAPLPGPLPQNWQTEWYKVQGALHPQGLLSAVNPLEEILAPGASTSGWVRRHTLPA